MGGSHPDCEAFDITGKTKNTGANQAERGQLYTVGPKVMTQQRSEHTEFTFPRMVVKSHLISLVLSFYLVTYWPTFTGYPQEWMSLISDHVKILQLHC